MGLARSQDDLTHKYANIIRCNTNLERLSKQGTAQSALQDRFDLLQYHVATLMDNEISGEVQDKQKNGKVIKSIRQRLVGKGGRVRSNLMGKRVDFSARTVITGDPNIGINQVGVPRSVAMNLTFPEVVTKYNRERLLKLVENGPTEYPGANRIINTDGGIIDLRYVKSNQPPPLEYGYTVERHLNDGDYVLFNRQPSLHKMSLMAHRAKIFPYSTFRLNLSCTTPYNADFDGDEMNLHVPQTVCLSVSLGLEQLTLITDNRPHPFSTKVARRLLKSCSSLDRLCRRRTIVL